MQILPNSNPTHLKTWDLLIKHFKKTSQTSIEEHFEKDPNRLEYSVLEWEDFYVDVSKNRITKTFRKTLCNVTRNIKTYYIYIENKRFRRLSKRQLLPTYFSKPSYLAKLFLTTISKSSISVPLLLSITEPLLPITIQVLSLNSK